MAPRLRDDGTVTFAMAPPNPFDIAADGLRTLRAFGQRIPGAGDVLARSLEDAVSGRTVMITGASSGIGKAAALEIGEAGGTMLLVARAHRPAPGGGRRDRGRSAASPMCIRAT